MSGAAMSLITAISGFLLLLTVTAVQGQNGWGVTYTSTQIYASKGSTVEIHCTYMYPSTIDNINTKVQKTLWFTKVRAQEYVDLKADSDYRDRVEYECGNSDCTLRITDLRESDSAEYKFRFITNHLTGKYTGSPGVTLTVTDLQVQVSRSAVRGDSKSADLKCESSCPLPDHLSYVWYKNDQIINGQTSNSYSHSLDPTNRISCAVEGHENSRSPSVEVKDVWDVTYTSTQICTFRGSTVEIHCTYRYPSTIDNINTKVQKTLWFTKVRDQEPVDLKADSDFRDRVEYWCNNSDCTLRITDLRESDSAEYKFRFITNHLSGKYSGSPGVSLTVTDPQLQVHVRRSTVNSYSTWTELTCHSNCQRPDQSSYIWYKNGDKLSEGKQYFYLDTFDSTGNISCAVKGHEGFRSPAVYAPTLPSVSVSPSAQIVEGSSVTLTCSSDANPAANYTWYKEDDHNPLSHTAQHVFSSIQPSDSGNYSCTSENDLGRRRSGSREIDVKYAPTLPSVSVSPSAQIVEGSSVTLTCSSDANPAANYTWYKEDDHNPLSHTAQHVFSSIQPSDSGNYSCTSENDLGRRRSGSREIDVKYAPKLPSVSVSPSAQIVEGSSVTLTCSSDANPAAKYTWYKEDDHSPLGYMKQFNLSSIQPSESGHYYCTAKNKIGINASGRIFINVTYAPKAVTVSVSPTGEIKEGSSVTLTCSSDANPAAKYTWYKEDEDSAKASGQNFTITDFRPEHSGSYYCVAQNTRGHYNSTLQLTVIEVFSQEMKLVVIGTTLVVFLAIICLSVFLLLIKKRSTESSPEPQVRPDNNEKCRSSQAEEDEELHYASVQFIENQTDPIYYNIRSAGHRRQMIEEDEHVEYAAVKFNSPSSAPRTEHQESEEDTSALYSTVKKI